jgi:benzodiazapine receptor
MLAVLAAETWKVPGAARPLANRRRHPSLKRRIGPGASRPASPPDKDPSMPETTPRAVPAGLAPAPADRPRTRLILHAVIAAVSVCVAASLGSAATLPQIPTWYAGIAKPWFNPPNWVFGPVWTMLFAVMAFSFWRILEVPAGTSGRTRAILVFAVQLVLNALWSIVFFGLQNPPAALVVVLALELSVIGMIVAFRRLDPPAGWMNVPYALWVAFATLLNVAIVLLNH